MLATNMKADVARTWRERRRYEAVARSGLQNRGVRHSC
jgi:hypothetical protein